MKIFDLSISPNYVGNWSVSDAIRELLQNAIDQGNMEVNYEDNTLSIYSPDVKLDVATLVLGNTTKGNDKAQIGQYGEGYKLALLVLLRNGYGVTIYNDDEVWTPFFDKSELFGTPILKISVDECSDPTGGVTFAISNLSKFVYDDLRKLFPCIENNFGETVQTEYGDILLDKQFEGRIFVKGLYVQTDSSFRYGYNFNPEVVTLDRDRKAINYWDLRRLTAASLITVENCHPKIFKAISDTYTDAKDILDVLNEASETFLNEFKEMYYEENDLTDSAIVVTKGVDRELSGVGALAALVSDNFEDVQVHVGTEIESFIIAKAQKWDWFSRVVDESEKRSDEDDAFKVFFNSPYRKLLMWYRSVKGRISKQKQAEFLKLMNNEDFHPSYFGKIRAKVFANIDKYLDDETFWEDVVVDEDDD